MRLTEADMYEVALGRTKNSRVRQLLGTMAGGIILILLGTALSHHSGWLVALLGVIVIIVAFIREMRKQRACAGEAKKLYEQYLKDIWEGGHNAKEKT